MTIPATDPRPAICPNCGIEREAAQPGVLGCTDCAPLTPEQAAAEQAARLAADVPADDETDDGNEYTAEERAAWPWYTVTESLTYRFQAPSAQEAYDHTVDCSGSCRREEVTECEREVTRDDGQDEEYDAR